MKIEKVYPAGWKVTDNNNDITYVGEYGQFGCYCNEGVVYKDREAFDSGVGVCYIPEYDFDNSDENGSELFEFCAKQANASDIVDNHYTSEYGYTRHALEILCGDNIDVRELFEHLDWMSPETLIDEWEREELFEEEA